MFPVYHGYYPLEYPRSVFSREKGRRQATSFLLFNTSLFNTKLAVMKENNFGTIRVHPGDLHVVAAEHEIDMNH